MAAAGLGLVAFQYFTSNDKKEAKAFENKDKGKVLGEPKSAEKKIVEYGTDSVQTFEPIEDIHKHLCAYHFYSGDISRQVEAHHYCTHLNEDVAQCAIFDSDQPNARLIGVEYLVSEKVFKNLPKEEQQLWHIHAYEVTSGSLIAPGIPEVSERKLMQDTANTYGKTFHTWEIDRGDKIPTGIPKLMMAFTEDKQLHQELLDKRDKKYGISTEKLKSSRKNLKINPVLSGSDQWKTRTPIQTNLVEIDGKNVSEKILNSEL